MKMIHLGFVVFLGLPSCMQVQEIEVEPIQLHYYDRPPYLYTDSNGSKKGLTLEIAVKSFTRANIPFRWVMTNSSFQLDILRENKTRSCLIGWFKNKEREQFAKYTSYIYRDDKVVVLTGDQPYNLKYTTLKMLFEDSNKRIMVKSDYSYGFYIDELIKKYKPESLATTRDNIEMLGMLRQGLADYFIISEDEAFLMIHADQNNPLALRIGLHAHTLQDIIHRNKRYIICSNIVSDKTINRLNNVIPSIRKVH